MIGMLFGLMVVLFTDDINRELNLASSYLELKEPKHAEEILQKIVHKNITPEERFEAFLKYSESQIGLDQPLIALRFLQQLIQIDQLTDFQKGKIYHLVSEAFIKLKNPERAVLYATLSDNFFCEWNHLLGNTDCQLETVDQDQFNPNLTKIKDPENVIDEAIATQQQAIDLTSALPFINSFQNDSYLKALDVQKKIKDLKAKFVEMILLKEKKTDCDLSPFEETTSPFEEGLDLALMAELALFNKKLTFGSVIPLQEYALEKFQEAKNAYSKLQSETPTKESNAEQKEKENLRNLQNMMENDREKPKAAQGNIDKVIW